MSFESLYYILITALFLLGAVRDKALVRQRRKEQGKLFNTPLTKEEEMLLFLNRWERFGYWFRKKFLVPERPYALSALGWHEHNKKMKEKYPIRFTIEEILDDTSIQLSVWKRRFWTDIIWWVKHRTTHKFHVIQIPTLSPGFYDKDTQILHGMFGLLTDYIEVEKGLEVFNWDADEDKAKIRDEMVALYDWWTKTRPNRVDVLDELSEESFPEEFDGEVLGWMAFDEKYPDHESVKKRKEVYKRSWKQEEDFDNEDTEMLIRLIRIRKHLWA